MSERMSFSLTPGQSAALDSFRFNAKIGNRSKAVRALMRAGIEALAEGDSPRAEAARAALAVWQDEDSKQGKQKG